MQGITQCLKIYEYMTDTIIYPLIMIHDVISSDNSKINGKRKKDKNDCNIILTYGCICVIIKKTIVKHTMEVNTMKKMYFYSTEDMQIFTLNDLLDVFNDNEDEHDFEEFLFNASDNLKEVTTINDILKHTPHHIIVKDAQGVILAERNYTDSSDYCVGISDNVLNMDIKDITCYSTTFEVWV